MPDSATSLTVAAPDGVPMHVVRRGAGAPIVLLHGITASSADWKHLLPHLPEDEFETIAVDLRGHGETPLARSTVDTVTLASDVAAVLDGLDLHEVVLVGHSLGGYAALATAAHQLDAAARVRHIVAIGSSPTMRGPRELLTLGLNASPLTKVNQLLPYAGDLTMSLMVFGKDPDPALVADVRRRWARCSMATRVAHVRGLAGERLTPVLRRISQPVDVMRGSHDVVIAPSRVESLLEGLPHAAHHRIEGAGHVPHIERPTEVAAVIAAAARSAGGAVLPEDARQVS
jgi:pimeloyl-ACP methyl ester carboxylesterase